MSRVLFASLVLLAGCAKGAVDDGGDRSGSDGGGRDSGTGGRDLGMVDLGPGPDMGGEFCEDDAYPEVCDGAEDLGEITPGATPLVVEGYLPLLSDEDWFVVRFPPADIGAGGGVVAIDLSGDATTVMTLEGPTCGPRTPCGEGMAGAILAYSFTDDQDVSDEMPYQTRDTEWPEAIFIRVHRSGGPAGCTPYELTISR